MFVFRAPNTHTHAHPPKYTNKIQTTVPTIPAATTTPQPHPTQPPTLQHAPNHPSTPGATTTPMPVPAPQITPRIVTDNGTPTPLPSDQSGTALGGDSNTPFFTSIYWELGQFQPHLTGEGTVIAILDTGINTQHLAFSAGQRVLPAPQYSRNFVQGQSPDDITDLDGHGTHCAGIAAGCSYANAYLVSDPSKMGIFPGGVAPGAQLTVCRVANDSGPTSYTSDSVVQALDHLIDIITNKGQPVHVVSMSFGFPKHNAAIEERIFNLKKLGTICIAAASNEGQKKAEAILYPASDGNVICIGAHNSNGNRADISPAGREMEYLALGVNVCGPAAGPNAQALRYDSGTSYAAPAVAGLASLLIELARKNGENIPNIHLIRHLLKEMSPTKQPSYDSGYGTLRPQEFLSRLIKTPGLLKSITQEVA